MVTQNFWRSAENLAINPSAGNDRWAVAQAGPFRRVDVHGGLELGIGFPTLIPVGGVNTMQVADVDGVRIDGLLFDAGTTNSNALLTIGTSGSNASHASNPISVQDTFFRIGGDIAGQATNSLHQAYVIEHVINSTGGPTPSNTTPVDVTSYP